MSAITRNNIVLVVDDDADDRLLAKDAISECKANADFRFLNDGEELMDYLLWRNNYSDPTAAPRPSLILLDLNMPKKDGHEALKEIKARCELKQIPVVIFTTSSADTDVNRTYDMGANSFISKPATFGELVNVIRTLTSYWLTTVRIPGYVPAN